MSSASSVNRNLKRNYYLNRNSRTELKQEMNIFEEKKKALVVVVVVVCKRVYSNFISLRLVFLRRFWFLSASFSSRGIYFILI